MQAPDSKRARVDNVQSSDDTDDTDDVIGKTALLVDSRNSMPSPSMVFFEITKEMPERMRQSLKENLLTKKHHSYMIITCRDSSLADDDRTVHFDDGAGTSDELVEYGEMEDEDCDKACEFFSKLLNSKQNSFVIKEPPNFVFALF